MNLLITQNKYEINKEAMHNCYVTVYYKFFLKPLKYNLNRLYYVSYESQLERIYGLNLFGESVLFHRESHFFI